MKQTMAPGRRCSLAMQDTWYQGQTATDHLHNCHCENALRISTRFLTEHTLQDNHICAVDYLKDSKLPAARSLHLRRRLMIHWQMSSRHKRGDMPTHHCSNHCHRTSRNCRTYLSSRRDFQNVMRDKMKCQKHIAPRTLHRNPAYCFHSSTSIRELINQVSTNRQTMCRWCHRQRAKS